MRKVRVTRSQLGSYVRKLLRESTTSLPGIDPEEFIIKNVQDNIYEVTGVGATRISDNLNQRAKGYGQNFEDIGRIILSLDNTSGVSFSKDLNPEASTGSSADAPFFDFIEVSSNFEDKAPDEKGIIEYNNPLISVKSTYDALDFTGPSDVKKIRKAIPLAMSPSTLNRNYQVRMIKIKAGAVYFALNAQDTLSHEKLVYDMQYYRPRDYNVGIVLSRDMVQKIDNYIHPFDSDESAALLSRIFIDGMIEGASLGSYDAGRSAFFVNRKANNLLKKSYIIKFASMLNILNSLKKNTFSIFSNASIIEPSRRHSDKAGFKYPVLKNARIGSIKGVFNPSASFSVGYAAVQSDQDIRDMLEDISDQNGLISFLEYFKSFVTNKVIEYIEYILNDIADLDNPSGYSTMTTLPSSLGNNPKKTKELNVALINALNIPSQDIVSDIMIFGLDQNSITAGYTWQNYSDFLKQRFNSVKADLTSIIKDSIENTFADIAFPETAFDTNVLREIDPERQLNTPSNMPALRDSQEQIYNQALNEAAPVELNSVNLSKAEIYSLDSQGYPAVNITKSNLTTFNGYLRIFDYAGTPFRKNYKIIINPSNSEEVSARELATITSVLAGSVNTLRTRASSGASGDMPTMARPEQDTISVASGEEIDQPTSVDIVHTYELFEDTLEHIFNESERLKRENPDLADAYDETCIIVSQGAAAINNRVQGGIIPDPTQIDSTIADLEILLEKMKELKAKYPSTDISENATYFNKNLNNFINNTTTTKDLTKLIEEIKSLTILLLNQAANNSDKELIYKINDIFYESFTSLDFDIRYNNIDSNASLYNNVLNDLKEAARQKRRAQLSNLDEQKLRRLIRHKLKNKKM